MATAFPACQGGNPDTLESEAAPVLEEALQLQCRLTDLSRRTVALWDSVAAALNGTLPADMPADERRNMIAVRNTDLIKMFMVYPSLDSSVHVLVEEAGLADAEFARQMRSVKDSIDANEEKIRRLLAEFENEQPSKLSNWKNKFDQIKCEE
jgi:hypothetical protein